MKAGPDRTAAIINGIRAGTTLRDLGRQFGITGERVRQVYTKATNEGVPPRAGFHPCRLCGVPMAYGLGHLTTEAHRAAVTTRRVLRFWSRVRRGSGCWEWQGYVNPDGYGHMASSQGGGYPHRYAYELSVGVIPDGMTIDHLCRNRRCVNPAHLEVVSSRENTLRSPITQASINAQKTHCPKGHPYAADNLYVTKTGHRSCRACRRAAVAA